MPAIDTLREFDLPAASISFWIFKGPRGAAGTDPKYMGRWVDTTGQLDETLKEIVDAERSGIEEVLEYGLLVQNHEASALSITTEETHADLLVDLSAAEEQPRKITNVKDLRNAGFYLAKLTHGDTRIHAVRKADSAWRTKKALSTRSVFFLDNELDVDERPHFEIARSIDFFIVEDEILCLHKAHMESILRYKETHKEDFQALLGDEAFMGIFAELDHLVTHVGENKIQLRRASAIRQKGHYNDDAFMARLRERHAQYGFTIQFDDQGRIIATPETCSQIITALLDHRLASGFSESVYDVPSATPVAL